MASKAQLKVGDSVLCKDNGDAAWLQGIVKNVQPLLIALGGKGSGYPFDQVKLSTADADAAAETNEDEAADTKEVQIIIENPVLNVPVGMTQIPILFLSVIQLLFVCLCLADGRSVVTLKENADLPTALTLPGAGALTLRQILFHPYVAKSYAPYGIGPYKDSMDRPWGAHGGGMTMKEAVTKVNGVESDVLAYLADKRFQFHPAAFLGCQDLIDQGLAAKTFCFIAVAAAALQVLVSILHLWKSDHRLLGKTLVITTLVIQIVLSIGFLIVLILIDRIMNNEFDCDNQLIKKLTVAEHFDFNYAIAFVIIGFLASLAMIGLAVVMLLKCIPAPETPCATITSAMPMLSQATIILLTVVQIVFVGIAIADGSSVVKLKEDDSLPTALSLTIGGTLTPLSLRQVLFHNYLPNSYGPYGIGPNHDSFFKSWGANAEHPTLGEKTLKEAYDTLAAANPNDSAAVVNGVLEALKTRIQFHPAPFLSCDGLADTGKAAQAFCFIALIACFAQLFVSAPHLFHPGWIKAKMLGLVTTIIQVVLTLGFLVVLICVDAIYNTEWACENPLIPKLQVSDHFDYQYGVAFVIIGFLASLVMVFLGLFAMLKGAGPTCAPKGGSEPPPSRLTWVNLIQGVVVVLSVVELILVAITIVDGQSVVTLKENRDLPKAVTLCIPTGGCPAATNVAVGCTDTDLNLRQVLFHDYSMAGFPNVAYAPYGIGPMRDTWNRQWTQQGEHVTLKEKTAKEAYDYLVANNPTTPNNNVNFVICGVLDALKMRMQFHPAQFLSCDDLSSKGVEAAVWAWLALIGIFAQIVVSTVHLWQLDSTKSRWLGYVTQGIQTVLFTGMCRVQGLIGGIYTDEFKCENPIIPKLTVSDHFDLHYAVVFVSIATATTFLKIFLGSAVGTIGKVNPEQKIVPSRGMLPQVGVLVLSAVQILFVAIAIADSQSVVTLKEDADLPTALTLPIAGVSTDLTLRQVLCHPYVAKSYCPYGIGPNHDTYRRSWKHMGGGSTLKSTYAAFAAANPGNTQAVVDGVLGALTRRIQFHPAASLDCADLQDHGWAARVFCFIAITVAFVQVLVSLLHIMQKGHEKILGWVTVVLQVVLALGFLIVIALIAAIYNTEFECDNQLIKKLTVSEHFDYNYAIAFVIIGMLASIANAGLGAFQNFRPMPAEI